MSDLFPDQVISEILIRLPSKSLCRFKSVSKKWASLIGNPKFILAYLNHHVASWVKLDKGIQLSGSDPIGFTPVKHSEVYTLTVNPLHLLKPDEPLSDPNRKQVPVTGYPKLGNQISQRPTNNAEIIHVSNGLVLFALWIDPDPFKDGMDEYGRRPWRTRWEKALPGDPRVKGNPEVAHFFIYSKDALEDVLFVANPVTREWARIPRPPPYLDNRACFGFVSDPSRDGEEFVIAVLECNHGSKHPGSEFEPKSATLTCFSSRVGKWVKKDAGYELSTLLGTRMWRPSCRFVFDGKMFWCDVSFGIVCWDEDPFIGAANVEDGGFSIVFVTLPSGRVENDLTIELMESRCVDSAAMGCIQYMELGECGDLEVWRLKDYRAEDVEWELVYRVVRDVLEDNCVFGLGLKISFVDPTNTDVVVVESVEGMFELNVRDQTVESYNGFIGHTTALPFMLPSFPPSLPSPLYADHAKEQGNGCFKGQNFKEAIAWYSRSISVSPSAVAYGNRAMAYLKVGRYREAEEDCSKCVDLDDRYFKGYARRARARKALGDLRGALEDLKFALTLEPKSEDVKELYDELKCWLGMVSCSDSENGDGDTTSDDDMDGECRADDGDGTCNIGIDGDPSLVRMYI